MATPYELENIIYKLAEDGKYKQANIPVFTNEEERIIEKIIKTKKMINALA